MAAVSATGAVIPATRPPPQALGRLQHAFAVFATLVFLGVNFGLNSGVEGIATKSSPLTTPIQAGLLLVLIGLAVRYRTVQMPMLRRLGPFLLLLGLAACSSLWSQAPDASLRRSLTLLTLMLFALYAHVVLGTVVMCRLQVVATWIAAAVSLLAAAAVPQSGFDLGEYATAVRGVFSHKNSLGDAMVAGITAVVFLVLRRRYVLWTDIATVLMALCVIRLSQSTTAFLLALLMVAATVCTLLWMRGTVWALYGMIVILTMALCLAWVIALDPSLFFTSLGKSPTLTGRAEIWRAVLRATNGLPLLGSGYAAFWVPDTHAVGDIWYELGWETPSAHSGYLDTAIQLGVVGLALLAGLAALTVARAVRTLGTDRQAAGLWALIQLGVIAILNYDESSLPNPDIHLLQWIIAFLACSAAIRGRAGFRAADVTGGFKAPPHHDVFHRR